MRKTTCALLSVLWIALIAWAVGPHLGAQEANSGAVLMPVGDAPNPGDPGREGEIRILTHKIYTYHFGLWGWTPRFPMQTSTPATNADAETTP